MVQEHREGKSWQLCTCMQKLTRAQGCVAGRSGVSGAAMDRWARGLFAGLECWSWSYARKETTVATRWSHGLGE